MTSIHMTNLYRRASIQAQKNRNQFEQAQASYERFCRRERNAALVLFGLLMFGVAVILAVALAPIL